MSPLTALESLLDPSCILVDRAATAPFLTDWHGRYHGSALAVLRPRNVEEVSAILRWASATATPVVPQGGNTGLAGGATPDEAGRSVVLSLGRLDRIRDIDPEGNTIVAEAGCILAQVQKAAAESNRLFPVSLGSEGSCQIGGIVATNAGGINVIRYGTTRDLVLGLEYVRADGAIVHGLKRLRKDNAGYDLRHLLVGSEGTLAVITAAALKLFPRPCVNATALCGLDSPAAAVRLLSILREALGERISSFELMCDGEMALTLNLQRLSLPLSERHAWYAFVEIADTVPEAGVEHSLAGALSNALEVGLISDAIVASNFAQARAIWHLRFAVSEANRLAGPNVSHDTSVATADVPAFIEAVQGTVAQNFPMARPLFVGHVGDGNIHVIILFPEGASADRKAWAAMTRDANACVFEIVGRFGGSITAEHGIGCSLVGALERYTQPESLELMRAIKSAFDPLGILNPGKMLAAR